MPAAYVQSVGTSGGNSSDSTIVSPSINVSAGSSLAVFIQYTNAAAQSISISNAGTANTYTLVGTVGPTANNDNIALYRSANVNAFNGAVTVTLGAASTFRAIVVTEVSGAPNWGVGAITTQSAPGTGTDAITVTTGSLGSQPAIAIALSLNDSANRIPAVGTGWTDRGQWWAFTGESGTTASGTTRLESKAISSTGAQSALWTAISGGGSDVYANAVAIFSESAGGSSTTVTPGVGSATIQGKTPSTSAFQNVRIREVLVNASGQPVGSLSNVGLRVWYSGLPIGAPDVSLSAMTTDTNGTTSWSIATGTLAFNQPVFYVAYSSDASASIWTCARLIPSYE